MGPEIDQVFYFQGMLISAVIWDDDSHDAVLARDHIDTLISEIEFWPASDKQAAIPKRFEWLGETR